MRISIFPINLSPTKTKVEDAAVVAVVAAAVAAVLHLRRAGARYVEQELLVGQARKNLGGGLLRDLAGDGGERGDLRERRKEHERCTKTSPHHR